MKKIKLKSESKRQIEIMRGNLKFLRAVNNLTIKKLSELSEIGEITLTEMENGEDFDVGYLIRLCGIYRISPYEIFCELEED